MLFLFLYLTSTSYPPLNRGIQIQSLKEALRWTPLTLVRYFPIETDMSSFHLHSISTDPLLLSTHFSPLVCLPCPPLPSSGNLFLSLLFSSFPCYSTGVSIATTLSLGALAIAWGFCNYGFITYIPTMLTETSKHSNRQHHVECTETHGTEELK